MEWARSRRGTILIVERGYESSRVQEQLMAAAYELAAPQLRRRLSPLSAKQDFADGCLEISQPSHVIQGGITA